MACAYTRPKRTALQTALRNLGIQSSESEEDSDMNFDDNQQFESDEETVPINNSCEWRLLKNDERKENEEFLSTPGVSPFIEIPDGDIEKQITFFLDLYFTDHLIEKFVEWTNIRVQLLVGSDSEYNEYLNNWKDVTPEEIKKFFAITFYTGLVKKPTLAHYWSRSEMYSSPLFNRPECLTRDRYTSILRLLRFCDYSQNENDTIKFQKIKPLCEMLKVIWMESYLPEENVCIDEKLMLFKGRVFNRQYIPSKQARYGIKTYALCESKSGYVWNFITHTTKEENNQMANAQNDSEHLSLSEKVVVELAHPLFSLNYHIFADNWFSSVRLSEYLLTHNTYYTGTIRHNRGVPKILKDLKVEVHETAFAGKKDEVMIVKFVDKKASGKKPIYVIDTHGKASLSDTVSYGKGGVQVEVRKPTSILSYNEFMGGVDLTDSSIHHYDATRKSTRWFTKYGIYLIQLNLRNAWVLYQKCGGKVTFLQFTESTIQYFLLSTGVSRKRQYTTLRQYHHFQMPNGHVPFRLPPKGNKVHPAKRCRICCESKLRKETVFVCKACPSNPGLCPDPCFGIFHQRLQNN